jgi:nitrate reductase gamma subunit
VGHTVVLKEAFGFYWPAMPNVAADALSWVVVITGLLLILRRYGIPEVRVLSTSKEYGLVLLAMAPFVTGLLAAMGGEQYRLWLTLHVLSGELWLLLIPFTRLSHAILFFCSRTQLGMDFGIKRGGMKNKGIAW